MVKLRESTRIKRLDGKLQSAARYVQVILSARDGSEFDLIVCKQLINRAVWTYADSIGKKDPPFVSAGVAMTLGEEPLRNCRAEHVFQRHLLVEKLINASPEEVTPEKIQAMLSGSIIVRVTVAEDKSLPGHRSPYDGWERYVEAKLNVYHPKTRQWIDFTKRFENPLAPVLRDSQLEASDWLTAKEVWSQRG